MWLSNDEQDYSDDCSKEQGNEKMRFRSNSPPLEGGESLCEFYIEHSEKGAKLKSLQISATSENARDALSNIHPSLQNNVFHHLGQEKFSNKNFVSLFNQDLLSTNSFTQTFLQSILSSVDSSDPVVANAWMETLLDVIDFLPKEIIKGEILTLAVNKGQLSQPVSSRLLCCKMLGKICMKFDSYVILKEVLPVVLSLCQDVDYEVRGYMCRQLAVIAKGIGLEATKSAILPELVELANDEEIFVRLAGIETVVQMLQMLDDDTCKQAIIPLVMKFCETSLTSKDSSLPVVSKQLGQLCHGLVANFTEEQKQWFLRFFQDLSKLGLSDQKKKDLCLFNPMPDLLPEVDNKDRYQECRCACAFNFPAMVLFAGPENFEAELYFTFKELCTDPFQNVRQTMACGFSEIARLLNVQAYVLKPELVLLLQDESVEVLKRLIPFLPESLKAVCCKLQSNTCENEDSEQKLVNALISCEEASSVTSNWRLHADFLSCLSCLPFCISSETIFTTFVPLLFVKLHTARPIPCRTSAAYSLLIFLRSTPGIDRRKGIINELIRELCHGRSCHKRMLFIQVCELVIELFSKVFFKLHFFKPLLGLSADRVPNIRLRLCVVLPRLKSLIKLPKDNLLLQELESCVKTLMTGEKDRDVSSAVSKAIEELDKIEVATETVSRRSSASEFDHDLKDLQKENEERQLLELEFSLRFGEKSIPMKSYQVLGNVMNKTGKIPIRKCGTLPKPSKNRDLKSISFDKLSPPSPTKSLRNIKKERRISSPGLNLDVQKKLSSCVQAFKSCHGQNTSSINLIKYNIPPTKMQSTSITNTWPRQKRSSNIPKQALDRCPSPMPIRHFSDHLKKESFPSRQSNSSLPSKQSPNEATVSDVTKQKEMQKSLQPKYNTSDTKRSIPLSSPEVLRKSATFSNLSSESKIPKSSPRRRSMIKD